VRFLFRTGHSYPMKSEPPPGRIPHSSIEALALAAWEAIPNASSLVFDTELRYVVARGPTLALHGLTSTDLEGQLAEASLPPERWKLYEPLYRGALEGKAQSIDVTSTDENRTCRVHVGPLRGDDGDIVGGVSLGVDTTDIRRGEERYRHLFESAPDAVIVVDEEGVIREANSECERLFGYPCEELEGAQVEMLIPERFRDKHRKNRAAFSYAHGSRPMGDAGDEFQARREDGSEFPVNISLSSVGTDGGVLVSAVIRDVRAEQRLADSLGLLEALQSAAPVGMVFVDRELRVQRINETLAAGNGTPIEDQIGRPAAELVPELWPQLEPAYRYVLETEEALLNQDIRLSIPDAPEQDRVFLTSYYPVHLGGEMIGIGAVAVDVTEAHHASEFQDAVMDTMAEGVYTQDSDGRLTYMNRAATEMLGYSEDELLGKSMHDAVHYQHADGTDFPADQCEFLQAQVESTPLRKSEDAFTRKDGSIFPVATSAASMQVGSDEHGLVVVFRDISTEQAEIKREQRVLDNLVWVGRTRDALDEDRLVLYSQPIVPLGDGAPREELLVRMLGHDGELIAPGVFLPAAEKHGLIGEVDRWVISQAIQLAQDGRCVDANLSGTSVSSAGLLSEIEQQIGKAGVDPTLLGFEITETALMRDPDVGKKFAQGVVGLGCSLSLDDFGTGFGGLTYLKQLPFSFIKIDIEFIRDLPTSKANQHVVEGIVNLTQGFGQSTIAEGVEDAETLEMLRELKVDCAQGYYIGRPAPI